MHDSQKMCMMCMILSPNCCVVTLPSCLSVPSEPVASQSNWQSADLGPLKLAKKRKMCGQRYSDVTCAFSLP